MKTAAAAVNKSTANTNKQQAAKEVIAANVQALIEQLELGHSEALTAYLTAMGRFAHTVLATFWKLRGRSRTQPALLASMRETSLAARSRRASGASDPSSSVAP